MTRDYDRLIEGPAQINGERVANLTGQEASRRVTLSSQGVQGAPAKCRRGSGAIFSIEHRRGRFYLFGDRNMDAFRYFPQFNRREEEPSGRIVPAGRGFAAVDSVGNVYFAKLEKYR